MSDRTPARTVATINGCAALVLAPQAAAQAPPPPAPVISAPAVRATGVTIPLHVRGAAPGAPVVLQRHSGGRWVAIKSAASFFAGPGSPGTSSATFPAIAASVGAARRRADVVIATFHWGVERATTENARQRAFAQAALRAGATAVIGAHPHVLQPIRRLGGGRFLIAYSLGNFVWSASSAASSRTGILRVALSARGVRSARLLPVVIESTRPRLR